MTSEERFERMEKTLDRVDGDLELLAQHVLKNEARLGVLTEKLINLADSQKKTDEIMREVGERLNIVIGIVERHFSNGRKS